MKKEVINIKEILHRIFNTIELMYNSSKINFLLIIILSIFIGISTPINILIWKNIIDYSTKLLIGDINSISYIIKYFILHFLVTIINIIFIQILSYVQNIFGTYVDKNITEKILSKTQQLQLKHFDQSNIYNIIQKASNESFQRSMSILQTVVEIVKNISSSIGLFFLLFNFSKICITICVLSSIPLFYINNRISNKWFEVFNNRFEKLRFAKHLKTLCINYENIKELKIFNVSGFIKNKILNIYENNLKEDKEVRKVFLLESSVVDFIDQILTYLIKGIIVFLIFKEKGTIGSLVTYIQAIDSIKISLNNTMAMISHTYENSLYMKSLFELLNIEIENEKSKINFNSNFEKIEFVNVSFKYPNTNKYVIKNFNYIFETNRTYALVGLNGSGKTTLIKLILGLYETTTGEIFIDNININHINKESMYKYVSAIFQDFIKYPFNIKNNITLGNNYNEENDEIIDKVVEFTEAKDFIYKLPEKYNTKVQKGWENSIDLSLGQWQKLAIARAAIKPSTILILDEPTASIDAITEFKMFNNFKSLKCNKLCVLVTHRFSSIKIADKILVIEDGELKQTGTHEELMIETGLYKSLYNLQADAYKTESVNDKLLNVTKI